MRSRTILALVSVLGLTPAVVAWQSAGEPLALDAQSRLWIDGKSTVRKFSCKASAFSVEVDAAPGALASVLSGTKAVRAVTLTVPAAKLDCSNGTMNEHMLKALKAKDAPTIEFKLGGYDVDKSAAGVQGTLTGTLTLGGQTRPVSIAANGAPAAHGALHVTGSYQLDMKEYGLKPPSLMMGTMKVDPVVTVNFDLLLKPAAIAAN
jgi:polyisoprenoid-binding protein YceI